MALEPDSLHVGQGWLLADFPELHFGYMGTISDDREFERYLRELGGSIEARPPGSRFGVLYYSPLFTGAKSQHRRALAKLLNDERPKLQRVVAAQVMVTSSAFIRGMLSTLNWVAPPPYPNTSTSTIEAALAFIQRHLPALESAPYAPALHALLEAHTDAPH